MHATVTSSCSLNFNALPHHHGTP